MKKMAIMIIAILMSFCISCASTQTPETFVNLANDANTKTALASTGTNCPYDNSSPGQMLNIVCKDNVYTLDLDLEQASFKNEAGNEIKKGTEIDAAKLLLVGDFKSGWSTGRPGKVDGTKVSFDISMFSAFNDGHRLQIRLANQPWWLMIEGMEATVDLVSSSMDTRTNALGICLGIYVANKQIFPWNTKNGGQPIPAKIGLMGIIKYK